MKGKRCLILATAVLSAGLMGVFGSWSLPAAAEAESLPMPVAASDYPDPDAGNENLLEAAGYANSLRVISAFDPQITAEGTTFTSPDLDQEGNVLIENGYLLGGDFYRTDTNAHSDGTDLGYVVSAEVTMGDYSGEKAAEGWYGCGIIFGETPTDYCALRILRAGEGGTNGVLAFHIGKGQSGASSAGDRQSGSVQCKEGDKIYLKVWYSEGKIAVFADNNPISNSTEPIMKLPEDYNEGAPSKAKGTEEITPRLGVHVACCGIKVENFSCKFIQPVKVEPAAAKSEETAVFDFEAGSLNATASQTAVTGDLPSFNVKTTEKEDYFLMKSKARALEKLYLMTGTESSIAVGNSTLTTVLTATVKSVNLGSDGKLELVFRHAAEGNERHQLVLKGTELSVETCSTETKTVGSCTVESGKDLELKIYSAEKSVIVYVNGNKAISAPIGALPNAFGVGGVNASYTVEGLSYKYIDDVKFEEPVKETYPERPPRGDPNTEYIEPPLPSKQDVPESGDNGLAWKIAVGVTVPAVAIIAGGIVFAVLRKRKSKSDEK